MEGRHKLFWGIGRTEMEPEISKEELELLLKESGRFIDSFKDLYTAPLAVKLSVHVTLGRILKVMEEEAQSLKEMGRGPSLIFHIRKGLEENIKEIMGEKEAQDQFDVITKLENERYEQYKQIKESTNQPRSVVH